MGTKMGIATWSWDELRTSDVVVVGAGLAGLSAALGCAPRSVTVLSKVPTSAAGAGGSSVWAQGGIAAAVGAGDSPAQHAADTLAAGAGLSDPEVAELLAAEGIQRIERLLELGVEFDRDAAGSLALGREAAHSRRRVLHAHGDATGAEIVRALLAALGRCPGVELAGGVVALDLLLDGERVAGVSARHADGRLVLHRASAVVLATGGIGRLYRHTTNPPESTGDGLAMAARAGARLVDLEFVQFHPTALAVGADPMPLVTEALRGEGAVLLDGAGQRFMAGEHELAELAPRDIVARAIWRRLEAGDRVVLDAREAVGESFPERFPTVFGLCQSHGLDPRRQPLPVSPAAHFHMGGIDVDREGRSSLAGLWACGEVAATGVHGANRLASNSLLEALVFGTRVAEDVRRQLAVLPLPTRLAPRRGHGEGGRTAAAAPVSAEEEAVWVAAIRDLAWRQLGLVRDEAGLRQALGRLARMSWELAPGAVIARNLHTVARLVSSAALTRRESRGGHYRSDYPQPDPAWRRRIYLTGTGREPAVLGWPASMPAAVAGAAVAR